MKKIKPNFRSYNPEQPYLLPPNPRDWLDDDDLVFFVMDLVQHLDLTTIIGKYDSSRGGRPAYDPTMMVSLLFYSYCVGVFSSRKIEQATHERIPFRVLTANQNPDHDTIADFRKRHLSELAGFFMSVLLLCQKAGLVRLGHVSIDGTKVRANASKHKAMSYDRMEKKIPELEEEVRRLLDQAERVDQEEDEIYGKGCRGDELPKELRSRKSRIKFIKEAMAELEAEAKAKADEKRNEQKAKAEDAEKTGKKQRGRKPKKPSDKPLKKSQRNFTDPESRIMKDGATKAFVQAYNCQVISDQESQIICASNVTQQANDKQQIVPLVEEFKTNFEGSVPIKLSGDAGYFSETNVAYLEAENIDSYIATGRQKHSDKTQPAPRGRIPKNLTTKERMSRKLRTKKGKEIYKERKQIVEPVFGQTKEARGFRQFLLRGLENVQAEWDLVCLTHNILKLFRSGKGQVAFG